jgi:hypothetical protein
MKMSNFADTNQACLPVGRDTVTAFLKERGNYAEE